MEEKQVVLVWTQDARDAQAFYFAPALGYPD